MLERSAVMMTVECAYCKAKNKGVPYVPKFNLRTFWCQKCKRENKITLTIKIEKVE